jgi:hypothetical protein
MQKASLPHAMNVVVQASTPNAHGVLSTRESLEFRLRL